MKGSSVLLGIALLLLTLAMAAKPMLLSLPNVPPRPPAGSFDTQRAMARLARILGDQRPHPVDSAANDAVRTRLVAEIRALGLLPTVTDSMTCNGDRRSRNAACARIRNVRATIGPASGRHVLVVSHYDSTPVGPGAADDGIGVAVSLELAALLKDRPLPRPITFLFDEGEELELNGARAFLQSDPLAGQVDSAINLEARGDTGPAIMFETSRPNAAAVALFKAAAWHPVANSLTADFYSLIPNDTDVSVFRARRWTILNFAPIGHESRYHSPDDRLAALDPRSVRHMGEQSLRAAVAMAGASPDASGDRLYADLLGRGFLALPMSLGLAMLVLLITIAFGFAWRGRRGIGRASAVVGASLAGAAVSAGLLQHLVGRIRPGDYWRAHPELIATAVDLTALGAALTALALLGRPCTNETLRRAFWLLFLLIGAGLCLVAPGAAIFFLLPPAVALAGALAGSRRRPLAAIVRGLACLLLFLSWAPLLHLSEVLLDFEAAWIFAVVAALILLPALIELRGVLGRDSFRAFVLPVAIVVLAAWGTLLFTPAYSLERKQAFGIEYARSRDSAHWLVANDGAPLPPDFAGFVERVKVSWTARRRWAASAPLLPAPAPAVERLAAEARPLGRLLRLRLHAGGSDALMLRTEADAPLLAVRAGGPIARFGRGGTGSPSVLRCNGRSCDGLVVDLLVAGSSPVKARLIGFRYALPRVAKGLTQKRPNEAAPHYLPDATVSIARLEL